MLLRSIGPYILAFCDIGLELTVQSMMQLRPLAVMWIVASVLYPASVRAACARIQVNFGSGTPVSAPVDQPMDTG